jgi:hypothetical protein
MPVQVELPAGERSKATDAIPVPPVSVAFALSVIVLRR